MNARDPRQSRVFRFVRCGYDAGVAELVYAFDEGPEMVERIRFPGAPAVFPARREAVAEALRLLHLVAGVSYYKAGVPPGIEVDGGALDDSTADLLDAVYVHGLAEFAYQNRMDLRERIRFPRARNVAASTPIPSPSPLQGEGRCAGARSAPFPLEGGRVGDGGGRVSKALDLPRSTLIPLGGGKDSLVTVELLRTAGEPCTVAWVGGSELIKACAIRTGLPTLNIGRELSPILFELNRNGAWNGHIPVTAINSAILVLAALLYGHDAIAFSNERSASSATLESAGVAVNHQWSKSWEFERAFGEHVERRIAADLRYYSLLRPLSELAVTRLFAPLAQYQDVFSSCNRNFRILGARPESRWCGQCPKCHFVFLALAPFVSKPQLMTIFGRNMLDDATLAPGFDALVEWHAHKPFECVGEAQESRAAFATLARRAEWREDALVARFREEILPAIDARGLALEPLLRPMGAHRIPARLVEAIDALR